MCLIRHIDYKNTKMHGIDQINKGLSFAIEMREQIASKAQDVQTPLNINVIIRRKVESKRGRGKGRRREREKKRKGEEEKERRRVERFGMNFRYKRDTQRKSPEFVMNSGLS